MNTHYSYPSLDAAVLKDKFRHAPKILKQMQFDCIGHRIILQAIKLKNRKGLVATTN